VQVDQGPDPHNGVGPSNNVSITNTQSVAVDNQNNKGNSHNCETTQEWINRLAWLLGYHGRPLIPGDPDNTCDPANLGVINNVRSVSDTGNNSASTGTGPGSIVDGFAQLVQSVLIHMNDTLTNID